MGNKFILYGAIAILMVIGCAIFPLVYYYLKLPSADAIKSGVSLSQLLSDFGKEFSSSISDDDVPEEMLCLSCLPYTSSEKSCSESMSSFVSKNLVAASDSMLSWHLSNAYLAKAILMKYEESALRSVYFAILANIFNERDLSSLCKSKFGKSCAQLDDSELRTLQRAFLSGKMPPPKVPYDDVFSTCFSR